MIKTKKILQNCLQPVAKTINSFQEYLGQQFHTATVRMHQPVSLPACLATQSVNDEYICTRIYLLLYSKRICSQLLTKNAIE